MFSLFLKLLNWPLRANYTFLCELSAQNKIINLFTLKQILFFFRCFPEFQIFLGENKFDAIVYTQFF